ncbi:MAG: thiamine pyrophosphate-requiring protein, partial [Dehalococcoidia bacterium]
MAPPDPHKPRRPAVNANELIARILKQEGVEQMTCFPNNPVIEAAAKEGIRPIMFRHERGAIMAADGFSRMSEGKRFGVVATQNAAGAENSVGGLAQAFADNVPILMLPGGYTLDERQVRPNFAAAENYRGVVKSVESIDTPKQTVEVMRRAFQALRNGHGGPVVVELTADACAQDVPDTRQTYHSPGRAEVVPGAAAIVQAVETLLKARRPMIWAGGGVLMAGASAAVTELAELLDLPVHTTMEGKSAIDERHPLALGAGSGATTAAAHQWIDESDVVLAIGSSLSKNHYTQRLPRGKTVIHNTIAPEDVNKDTASTIALVGDARLTAELLIEEAKRQTDGKGRDAGAAAAVAAVRDAWLEEWRPLLESDEVPLNTYRVIHEINENIDAENSTVTHDAGAPRDSMIPFFRATSPHSYIGWGKTTHLGFGIPLMIGAKMAAPERFCLNLMGDAAFGMSGLDIETSVRAGLPITTVILNNGGMATYPEGNIPEARARFGVTFMKGDYAKIAEGMGATGITVT